MTLLRHRLKNVSWLGLLTTVIVAADLLWILSLPTWPSQDGPMHLFYAHVLAELLRGHSVYETFFRIKHFAPPYALYYYVLLLFARFLPLMLADRIVICIYVVLLVTGFRALAQAAAPGNAEGVDRSTLLATLLVLNWPLGMGFVNYMLSVALALWALALWLRPQRTPLRRTRFVAMVVLVTLAHAVPLLLVLGVAGLELLTRGLRRPDESRERAKDFGALCVAALSLLYVWTFSSRGILAQRTQVHESHLRRALHFAAGFLQANNVTILFGHTPAVMAYRLSLGLVLLLGVLWGFGAMQQQRRRQETTLSQLFLGVAVLLLIALPWVPSDLSGAYFFAERMMILPWLFALVAAAGYRPGLSRRGVWSLQRLVAVFALLVNAMLLTVADRTLRPIAREAKRMEGGTSLHPSDKVLLLESDQPPAARSVTPAWNPYFWMPVHAVRAHEAVLVNAPWLDSPIIPLGARPPLMADRLDPQTANTPQLLGATMRADALLTARLLPMTSVVWFGRAQAGSQAAEERWLGEAGESWSCRYLADVESSVCRRREPGR